MRPEISDEVMAFLDMAVADIISHGAVYDELDTDAKIQVLMRDWMAAKQGEAKYHGQPHSSYSPPWKNKDVTPPWEYEAEP
jgi:hypothetical protein